MKPRDKKNDTLIIGPSRGIRGKITVPGDKSISHRAMILGGIAEGETRIEGFLEAEDCLATLQAMQKMGASIEKKAPGAYTVRGVGSRGLQEPDDLLDLGNSGTSTRLLIGLLAGYPLTATLTGDASIRRRPMLRVVEPIRRMGATILGREGGNKAPLTIQGGKLKGIDFQSPVASAQVKSALILAGLSAEGETRVSEPSLSRDHTERMLKAFGGDIQTQERSVMVRGGKILKGQPVRVPGDLSSAAFFIIAALVIPGSHLMIENVGLNPTRTGLLDVLQAMGGKVRISRQEEIAGECIGDIECEYSGLKGVEIGGELVPRMIDEFPILTLAAACAEGETRVRDAKELRVKESDRIASVARQLRQLGIEIQEYEDGYSVKGLQKFHPGEADSEGDHRIAMTLTIAAFLAEGETRIQNTECIETSFPEFFELIAQVHEEQSPS